MVKLLKHVTAFITGAVLSSFILLSTGIGPAQAVRADCIFADANANGDFRKYQQTCTNCSSGPVSGFICQGEGPNCDPDTYFLHIC